ncbi:ANTAR domain-containing protein [Kribbella sp. CA-293567]|uniref:ANTAR domain-containing protein n=1 Tax=Kribbella sp. CA-293567 TaxID=3002436 RepID=UPI0022DD4D43|nr:ANTAR domain-containing protein [Kribbella sp. CA-293567]WBQ04801.1 ANTAR domain-containing protein [Kribbella sp. CA-293567]
MPPPEPPTSPSAAVDRLLVPGPGLDVRFEFSPALLIARLTGRLHGAVQAHLPQTFRHALGRRPQRLLVDASGLVTCDAAGLAVLLDAITPEDLAVPAAISGLSPVYRRMLTLVCADREEPVPVFDRLEEAIRVLLSTPGPAAPDPGELLAEVRALYRAMLTRGAVDQACGVLMMVYRLDADAAAAMLVWHARRAGLSVDEVSNHLLTAVQDLRSEPLTTARADALLAELVYRRPNAQL